MNARCEVGLDDRASAWARAVGFLSTLSPDDSVIQLPPMDLARAVRALIESERAAAAKDRRALAKYQPRTVGAARTMTVDCDYVPIGELLAGYEVDEDGTVGLTHLWANGADIYPLIEKLPTVMKKIEARIKDAEDDHQEDV